MTLRLDFDGPVRVTVSQLVFRLWRAGYRAVTVLEQRSPSGHGWHVQVVVDPVPRTAMEVTALQAVLGSDPNRESCNVQRARLVDARRVGPYWRKRWNVLYGED